MPFGVTDVSADVQKMKDAGVDLVTTCMDQNGVLTIEREMEKQNLDAIQYLPNAYDHDFMEQYGEFFEGSYVRTRFAPFETKPQPKGLQLFNKWMDETGKEKKELALDRLDRRRHVRHRPAGSRTELHPPEGDRRAEQADRLRRPGHPARPRLDHPAQGPDRSRRTGRRRTASAVSKIVNKKFVPAFVEPGKPFLCFPDASRAPTLPDEPTNKA